ncbi:Fur family transcriptional regulator [Endozoicomonas sp. 4G]|uniref:Fur family transcriptional regulator n=1 Tax=Endozoicomonas sp. 4G TaxID=2872754 RepID=UPI002078C38C|nr:Fur family transcriptional regulator [Endozoicomonas sp. 4G]
MTSVHQPHDHHHCILEALQEARTLCQQRGVRLTHLREKVLELVWQSHQPVGAYDILAELAKQEERVAQPPTVYRALDFLMEQGLIHRLSSLNAFIGCPHPGTKHNSCFLICQNCRVTEEIDHQAINQSIASCASEQGFKITDAAIELTGLCSNCQQVKESL